MINEEIQLFIEQELSSIFLRDIRISRFNAVGGGSINETYQVVTNSGQLFFLKCNKAATYPGLFKEERKGLAYLQQYIRTPAIIFDAVSGDWQLLLLEWIAPGTRTGTFWKNFGEELAKLHQQSHPQFGFSSHNYMGSLPQVNTYTTNWVDFFVKHRLRPQVELASHNGLLPARWLKPFEKLYTELLSIFPEEKPSLLHGDLWSGNFICNQDSAPVLVDPAVYYGHRSVDLAMTTLFGQFDKQFYEAYHYYYPLPANYEEQWSTANLYPLLIHLNLFGSGYLASITDTLQHWKD
jgi:protein-ribulosamine 3-kinase